MIWMSSEDWARRDILYVSEDNEEKIIEHKFELSRCVAYIVESSTKYFKVAGNPVDVSSKEYCRPTEWDKIYWLGYWMYRFLIFVWQLTGLSFSGTVVSMIVRKMQQVIPELLPWVVVDSERPIHTFPSPYNRSLCASRTGSNHLRYCNSRISLRNGSKRFHFASYQSDQRTVASVDSPELRPLSSTLKQNSTLRLWRCFRFWNSL